MTSPARLLPLLVALLGCSTEDPQDLPDAGVDAPQPTSGVAEIDLGTITSTTTPVILTVPEHTLGFHVVVEVDGSTGTEEVGIEYATSPSGMRVVDGFYHAGSISAAVASRTGMVAFSVPQTSATSGIPVEAGAWSLVFSVPAGRTARARAYVRTTSDGEFHGGTLDVRIYIPAGLMISDPMPVHAVTAATAATDPCVIARVDSMFATLDQLFELGRGRVEFVELPAEFAAITDNAERFRALDLTTAGAGRGFHLIWTHELTLFGTLVWGSSAGIPGTATTVGHQLAAAVVNISLGFPAVADGMTMVHELGHFLGLFHTTELDRRYHDPLSDTPECATGAAVCPDDHNIMYSTFYGATGGVGLVASEHQRRVIWSSPLYTAAP